MVWPLIRSGGLKPDWSAILDTAIAACGDCGYYMVDEPYLQVPQWTRGELDAVAQRLPGAMLSLSPLDLQNEVYVPQGVTLGVNLYSSAGQTPASALRYLDTLATYGRPMYLNLDGIVIGKCEDVRPEHIDAAIALNEAMHAWAQGRVKTYIAFYWQTTAEFCGAKDTALGRYIVATFGKADT